MKTNRFRAGIIYASVFILAAILSFTKLASANSTSGDLFYTTAIFNTRDTTVWSVHYNFDGTNLTFVNSTPLAKLFSADGILFGTNGNLIVTNQEGEFGANPKFTEYKTDGTFVTNVSSAVGSYHLALSSSAPNALLYNAANGVAVNGDPCGSQCISAAALSGGGLLNGANLYTVSCDTNTPGCSTDVRGLIFDTNNKQWYYDTAPDGGTGEFGTVVFDDVNKTAMLTRLQTNTLFAAHGIVFDSFNNKLIVVSADTIQQLNEDGSIFSSFTLVGPGNYDQASVDGKGHLLVSKSNGDLEFVDYTATGDINGTSCQIIGNNGNCHTSTLLAAFLDDISPLSGLGSPLTQGVPEPSTLILFGIGVIAMARSSRRRET